MTHARRLVAVVLVAGLVGVPSMVGSGAGAALPTSTWELILGTNVMHSSPAVADVDGDGVNDVVVAGHDGMLRVYRHDGSSAPGWPQGVVVSGAPSPVDSSPAVADLDRDGRNEIVVGAGSLWVTAKHHGGVVAFNNDGSVRWRFVSGDRAEGGDGFADGVFSTPAIGDVDGDGYNDVVFGSWDHRIYALDRHGRLVSGFPLDNKDTVWSSPALHDWDGDGRAEIFIGGDSSGGDVPPGGVMRALDWSGGQVIERWRRHVGEIIISSPAIGDIDGDGRMEVVAGTGEFFRNAASREVWAWNIEDGSTVGGWPRSTGGNGWSSPALGDLDGDGRPDVVIASRDGLLYAYRGDGSQMWVVDPDVGSGFSAGEIISSPVIADVNGDGRLDVLLASGPAAFVLDGPTGARLSVFGEHFHYFNAPAVARFGSQWRVVLAGFRFEETRSRIATYDIPAPGRDAPWSMFRRGPARVGGPDLSLVGAAPGGYWIAGPDGAVYPFGSAVHYGDIPSLRRAGHTIGPARTIDMTSTTSGRGYWLLDALGGMFAFGDARFFGSIPALRLAGHNIGPAAVIGLAPTRSDGGYWLLDSVGGMFAFGDARYFGSIPGLRLQGVSIGHAPIVTMGATPSGGGYWILDAFGGMFAFGDARFFGSIPALRQAGHSIGPANIVDMAPTASGNGYWLLDDKGGLFAFGDARYFGSLPGLAAAGYPLPGVPALGLVPTRSGNGYWIVDTAGNVFAFGDAHWHGSLPVIGVASGAAGIAGM